jgi:MFS transporter, DHA2 family, multidrug resistance protein
MTPVTPSNMSRAGRPLDGQTPPGLPLSMAGGRNPWVIAFVVSLATFMEVLDTSIAHVALAHIAGNLSASLDESTWVLTSYLVSNAVVLPINGWLATVIGRKRFYMGCVALFTISSLLCGLAPSLTWLIIFRVLQGAGGGGLQPSEQSMLADTFPPDKLGMVFALYRVAVVVAPAVGPTLGGWITDNYSWHWVFLINVPVGLLSLSLTYALLATPPAEERRREAILRRGLRIDYIGFGLVALGLGCLQVVLDKGQREDWFASTFIISFTVIAAVALLALIVRELTHEDPVVDLPLLKNRNFLAANLLMFALGFVLFGTTQLLPQLVQSLLGYTATIAGLVLTPGGFVIMALMPVVGFLVGKV